MLGFCPLQAELLVKIRSTPERAAVANTSSRKRCSTSVNGGEANSNTGAIAFTVRWL